MSAFIPAKIRGEGRAILARFVVDSFILLIPVSAVTPSSTQRAQTKLKARRSLRATGKLRNICMKISVSSRLVVQDDQVTAPDSASSEP
jgi:hypothetical protein